MTNEINYQQLLNESMISLVKKVLSQISQQGAVGDHHFYISFKTDATGVKISKRIKTRYPQEITIVLQYQFENLKIFDDKFTVKVSFDGVPEFIEVPFDALTAFADPSVKFGIQLHSPDSGYSEKLNPISHSEAIKKSLNNQNNLPPISEATNLIILDKFRKPDSKHNKIS